MHTVMKKLFLLSVFLIFLSSLHFSSAALAPELVANDELKVCKAYYPSGLYELPSEWRIVQRKEINNYTAYEYDTQIKSAYDWEAQCKSLGYTYDKEPLQVMKPYYKTWAWIIGIVSLTSAILGTILLYRSLLNKKKSAGKWTLFIVLTLVLLFVLLILSQVAWRYVYPCSWNIC